MFSSRPNSGRIGPRAVRTASRASAFLAILLATPVVAQDPLDEPARLQTEDMIVAAPAMVPPAPVIHWNRKSLATLRTAIEASAAEGLRPADYRLAALDVAIAGGDDDAVDLVATQAARSLAHDYADGRITDRTRFDWHIDHSPAALATLDADLAQAVDDDRLQPYLTGLLPQDPRYAALRTALAGSNDARRSAAIRASMERWRWMPRTLGENYVMVNVPAYRLSLYNGVDAVAAHDVVVGARKTPTPMIAAYANSIVVNPWWTLPPSVLAEGKSYSPARGYVTSSIGGRRVIRQKPGPQNALGRIKIDMPNAYAIYLHDTPAKAAFAKADRALSHGCIRVKNIDRLASELDATAMLPVALEGQTTQTLQLERSLPVYIVYFTAGQDDAGKIVTFADPYGRDAALTAALDGTGRPTGADSTI